MNIFRIVEMQCSMEINLYRQVDACALCNILITILILIRGGRKNQENISLFCAVNISFPTMGASFDQNAGQKA